MDDHSDDQLLALVLARQTDALACLYDRHARAAYGLALRVVRDPLLAEEIVQEAFLRLWQRAATYDRTRGSVRTWLLRVVHHRAVDELRRLGSRPRCVSVDAALPLAARDDTEAAAICATDVQRLRGALDRLPLHHRAVVELAFLDGLSYPEVARSTGVPLGTVKSRMRVALERLRVLLDVAPVPATA